MKASTMFASVVATTAISLLACQCSDSNCLSGCQSKISGQCTNDYQAIVSCLTSNCASQCNASGDAG